MVRPLSDSTPYSTLAGGLVASLPQLHKGNLKNFIKLVKKFGVEVIWFAGAAKLAYVAVLPAMRDQKR